VTHRQQSTIVKKIVIEMIKSI